MVIDPGGPSHNKGSLSSTASSQKTKAAVMATPPAAPVVKATAGPADNVSFSAQAQLLTKLEGRISQAPDVDRGKVEAVKQALADGRYKIDAQKIAAAILAQEDINP